VTGDCIGPLVGHLLASRNLGCEIVGTLDSPVTALNIADSVLKVKRLYAGRKVIAVDSCVGEADELGSIRVRKGSLRPGLACGKSLPKVGFGKRRQPLLGSARFRVLARLRNSGLNRVRPQNLYSPQRSVSSRVLYTYNIARQSFNPISVRLKFD